MKDISLITILALIVMLIMALMLYYGLREPEPLLTPYEINQLREEMK